MILVDRRAGSKELLPHFRSTGARAELADLEAADFMFTGNGPTGPVCIGAERKTVNDDLIQSMRGKRLAGFQAGRLVDYYDVYLLIVEGVWWPDKQTGLVSFGKRNPCYTQGIHYGELVSYLMSLQWQFGIEVVLTNDDYGTATWLTWAEKWWSKPWDEHKTARTIYAPPPPHKKGRMRFEEPSLVVKMAAQLPGFEMRAWEVGKHFRTPAEMLAADEKRWKDIKGVGKTLAKNAREAIHGREES